MWQLIVLGILVFPGSAMAQQSLSLSSVDSVANYEVPTCEQAGCRRQVVEPEAATAKHGSEYGPAREWRDRVANDDSYRADSDDDVTCSSAVKALFKFACDDREDCEIENEYDSVCLPRDTDQDTAEECVRVVGSYVRQCFGGGCEYPIYQDGMVGGWLLDEGDEQPICSATMVRDVHDSEGAPVVITVPHCEEKVRPGTTVVRWTNNSGVVHLSEKRSEARRKDANPDLPVFEVYKYRKNAMDAWRPTEFAETIFQGYNRLIASRNKVLTNLKEQHAVTVEGETLSNPLYCDSSPLCTVVQVEGDEILHTCQSSRGGSGGALYQKIDDGWGVTKRVVVAVNNGATSSGQVTENEGIAVLRRD